MMSDKYPLTEKKVELRNQGKLARWQFTLSGWIRLILVDSNEMEQQVLDRMWEDRDYDKRIRDQYEAWMAEEPDPFIQPKKIDTEKVEDKIRKQHAKSFRDKGWKGSQRGKRKPKC